MNLFTTCGEQYANRLPTKIWITAPDRRSSPDPLRRSTRPARIPLRAGQFSADRIGPRPRNSAGESDSPDRRLKSIVRVQMIFCRRPRPSPKGPSSRTSFSAVAASRTIESWDGCCLASAGRDGPPGRSDPSDLVSWRGALILSGTTSALGAVEIISIDAIPATWSALSPLVLSVIACPQRNQAISRSDSNIDVPLARRVRAASITSAR